MSNEMTTRIQSIKDQRKLAAQTIIDNGLKRGYVGILTEGKGAEWTWYAYQTFHDAAQAEIWWKQQRGCCRVYGVDLDNNEVWLRFAK